MTDSETLDTLNGKALCHECIGEPYLKAEVRRRGKAMECDYCGRRRRCYALSEMADRVETAFGQHYRRTSDQPTSWQSHLQADSESSYSWYRDGESATSTIAEAAETSEQAAEDIREILDDRSGDFDAYQMGDETEFSGESHYERIGPNDEEWQTEWRRFERSLKTEARFFSRTGADHLASVFGGIDSIKTTDGRPLVVDAGPEASISTVFRARVFQAVQRLEESLGRPDLHLGPPPTTLASAGRMNARGISVFYGATDAGLAVAEVRPPVGSQVAVCRFEIMRPLRLLDLSALTAATDAGSIFDPDLLRRLGRTAFLSFLSAHMTRPVMPDDEAFDYLSTQAVADFLATENDPPLDGILFPSSQMRGTAVNIVLFHKAARVEGIKLPEGTTIEASSGEFGEDGWEVYYTVTELVPPEHAKQKQDDVARSRLLPIPDVEPEYGDRRKPALRVDVDSVEVHQVVGVRFKSEVHSVSRRRWTQTQDESVSDVEASF